jgi:ribosomal protein S18 acetylase RimI-like enzyme
MVKESRGKGLGSYMMKFMEEAGRAFGMRKSMLTVFKSNDRALQFYKRLGYA